MADSWGPNGASDRLNAPEAAELSRQIAGLAQAGLPLANGLVALGEELPAIDERTGGDTGIGGDA
jgi:type II secretory pathway component PulF